MQSPTNQPEQNRPKGKKTALALILLQTGIEFAIMIALPLIGLIYLGKWLDLRYQHHFFVILGILLALALSSLMIYKKIGQIKNLLK